jgi:hypothetical protein
MAATRGPQVVLEGYARAVARGGVGKTMRENIAAMDALVIAGLVADGNSVDGSARNGGIPYDTVVAQFPHEPLNAWEIPAPRLQLGSGSQIWDKTPVGNTPPVPGWEFSAIYGPQSAVDIFAKILNVPPRSTFNAVEGVITLPATATPFNTYHTGVSGFADNFAPGAVCFAVGGYSVVDADNCVTGAFGSVTVDSPLANGAYNNVRLQNEYDWYCGNPSSTVRGTLHDGYFKVQPNSGTNLMAFSSQVFVGPFGIGTASFNGTVMTVAAVSSGTFAVGMRLESTGIDGTTYVTITSLGSGTGGIGTYNLSANVGVIPSTTVRATSSYPWNVTLISPDGVAVVAVDIGQRNHISSLSSGSRSQFVQWRYSDNSSTNEHVMQQWIEPLSAGGVLYLQNFQPSIPASYGIRNNANSSAAYLSQNHAGTDWVDMLHLDAFDHTIVGSGSVQTLLATTQGTAVEVLDSGVPVTNTIGMAGATASGNARIYMVGGGNLQLANVGLPTNSTAGFVSPFPVMNGAPSATPANVNISNAFSVFNTQTKNLNIYDPLSGGWYHVALTAGAA